MKKLSTLAIALLVMAFTANAQLKGLGYDADLKQVSARIGLGANALDVGVGLKFDNTDGISDDAKFQISASGFFLGHLHDLGPVDTYFAAGGVFAKLPQPDDNIELRAFVGLQPEVTVLDHIALSTRFGLDIPVQPNFIIQTAGSGVSVTSAANFKILF